MTQDETLAYLDERKQIVAYLARVPPKYHTSSYLIAYYASFAEVFTPDMLYQLWLNFQSYYDQNTRTHHTIEMVAIADLLQSNLCSKIGYELYEMNPTIAAYFQALSPNEVNEKRHIVLAANTPTDVRHFVLEYAKRYYKEARYRHLYTRFVVGLGLKVAPEETLQELKNVLLHKGNASASAHRHLRVLIDAIATQQATAPQETEKALQLSHHRQAHSIDLTPWLENDLALWEELEGLLSDQLETKFGEKWRLAQEILELVTEEGIAEAFKLIQANEQALKKHLPAIYLIRDQFAAGQLSNMKYIKYKLQNILLETEVEDLKMAQAIERKEVSAILLLELIDCGELSQVVNILDYMPLSDFLNEVVGYQMIRKSYLNSSLAYDRLKVFIIFLLSHFNEIQEKKPRLKDLDYARELIRKGDFFEVLMLLTSFENTFTESMRSSLHQFKISYLHGVDLLYYDTRLAGFIDELKELAQNNLSAQDLIQQALETQATSLDLSNQGIEHLDDVPELTQCVHLRMLNLSNNAIREVEALGTLYNLEELYLAENVIQDVSPIQQLHKLKILDLQHNYIGEIDKDFLNDLPVLQQLFLANNSLENIPNKVFEVEGNCLLALMEYMSKNQITFGNTPTKALKIIEEANEKKLESIDLGFLGLTKIPSSLYELSHIKRIVLGSHRSNNKGKQNNVKIISSKIAHLIHLEELYLSDNDIQDLPEGMLSLKKLKILSLSRNSMLEIPKVVYGIRSLERLYLSGNPIQSISFRMLGLNNLQRLGLNGVKISGFPEEIEKLENCWGIVKEELHKKLFSETLVEAFKEQVREQYAIILRYRALKNETFSPSQRAKYQREIELRQQNINEIQQHFLFQANNNKRVSSIYQKEKISEFLDKLISKIEEELMQNTQTPLIFLAFANPQQDLNLLKEYEGIQQALAPLEAQGLVRCIVRNNITAEAYLNILEQYKSQITIFHFSGHANSEYLFFEDKKVTTEVVLKQLADNNPRSLELVFLNADVRMQNAASLFNLGIDTVIAAHKVVKDKDAIEFATYFYQSLAKGEYIKNAFDEAYASLTSAYTEKNLTEEDSFPWGLFNKSKQAPDYRIVHPLLLKGYSKPRVNTFPVVFTAFSNPKGELTHLRQEQNAIQEALMPLESLGLIGKHLTRFSLDLPQYFELFRSWQNRLSIFHLAGNLDNQEQNEEFFFDLLMQELVARNQDSLKLVFLNGCGTTEHIQALLDLEVKVIISAQGDVEDNLAANFAIRFYQRMAKGASIEEAFEQATAFVQLEFGVKKPPHILKVQDIETLKYRIVERELPLSSMAKR